MKALELTRFNKLEGVITRGLATFVEVGNALKEIRESRLYRAEFKTFESYCRERWGWNRNRANQYIAGAEVTTNVVKTGTAPTNEAQARPLTKLPPEKQPEAWERAVEKSGGQPTAKDVEEVVYEMAPRKRRSTGERRSFDDGRTAYLLLVEANDSLNQIAGLKRPGVEWVTKIGSEVVKAEKFLKKVRKQLLKGG